MAIKSLLGRQFQSIKMLKNSNRLALSVSEYQITSAYVRNLKKENKLLGSLTKGRAVFCGD